MTKPAKAETPEPDGPARITELHVFARPATDKDMRPILGKVACSKLSTLEMFFEKRKRAAGGKLPYDDLARLGAGMSYSRLWDTAQSSGRDSTQALNVSRGGGGGLPITQAQSDAARALIAIDSHMGQRDRIIVRMTCGEGHFPSEAVAMVSAGYQKATTPRYLEALDALVEAFEKARRQPGRVDMAVRP